VVDLPQCFTAQLGIQDLFPTAVAITYMGKVEK